MLYIVLVLVLAALGLLIAALTTASTLWAWLSIVISLAGATILFLDWFGNRRRAGSADRAAAAAMVEPDDAEPDDDADDAVEESAEEPVVDEEPADAPGDEPGEEQTDAADLLVVAGLSVQVRVVDERPRYHLAQCTWLVGRPSLALPVSEARQLGFTPCAVCTPDSVLAARHRQDKRQIT